MASEEYESAEILFEIARSEYQNEFNRTSVIGSKVGVTLPIIATYFFLVLQFDSIKEILFNEFNTENIFSVLWSVLIPLIYLAVIICAGISLIYLFRAIIAQSYHTIGPGYFNDKEKMSQPQKVFSAVMVTFYVEATAYNRSANNRRITMYKRGWSFALISLFLFVCYVVFTH